MVSRDEIPCSSWRARSESCFTSQSRDALAIPRYLRSLSLHSAIGSAVVCTHRNRNSNTFLRIFDMRNRETTIIRINIYDASTRRLHAEPENAAGLLLLGAVEDTEPGGTNKRPPLDPSSAQIHPMLKSIITQHPGLAQESTGCFWKAQTA